MPTIPPCKKTPLKNTHMWDACSGDHWVDLDIDGWIILGWISRRWDVGIWTGLGWPRIETGGRCS